MLTITSAKNPRVKQILDLRERKERERTGLFLIEGYREIKRALEGNWDIEALFTCSDLFLGTNEIHLIQKIAHKKKSLFSLSTEVFRKVSYRDRPDGLIAIAPKKQFALKDLETFDQRHPPLFVVAESIEKPGNLGTILRSADGVGVSGVIIADPCTDIYNPNVIRASIGTLFTLKVVQEQGPTILKWLKKHHIAILAATPAATLKFTDADLKVPLAIAVGTEQVGLSSQWLQEAHLQVSIPMRGHSDSLNVAMATTLLLYEADRQRHFND